MLKANQYKPQSVLHPGVTLSEKLQELGMGPKEFAVRTGKPEKTITAILKGDSAITPEMAVLFEHVLKIPATFWQNKQQRYDEYVAREKRATDIAQAIEWAKAFPLAAMQKFSWIPACNLPEEKVEALLAFFGIGTASAWEDYYLKSVLKVQFRISLVHTKEPQAISAWLRQGEIQAAALQAPVYSEKQFKQLLPRIKELMATQPTDFFTQLQQLCLQAGVKVVYTPCLPKAPTNGATRWLNDHALIQLSCRHKRNDIFWFTFFHEAGHILLHGLKDVFVEVDELTKAYPKEEQEADEFAVKWTFSEEEEKELMAIPHLTVDAIVRFAEKVGTHPALIAGRLIKKGQIHPSVGHTHNFFQKIDIV